MLPHPTRRQLAGAEGGAPGDEPMEWEGRLDTGDLGLVEGSPQAVDGGVPVSGMDEDLGDEVVVLGGNPVPGADPGIDPDPGPVRHLPAADPTGCRREVAGRVLGRDPDLDGVTCRGRGRGRRGQGFDR